MKRFLCGIAVWIILGLMPVCQPARAAVTTINLSAPVAAGEWNASDPGFVRYTLPATAFTVNEGDTVRVFLQFVSGESFKLFYDPTGPAIGTKGALLYDGPPVDYRAVASFSFAFLDTAGNPLMSASAARTGSGGSATQYDLLGDVTILQSADVEVGGLFFEFNNITSLGGGFAGLPITFDGVFFNFYDALLGEPFTDGSGPSDGAVPEPASIAIWGLLASFGLFVGTRRKRVQSETAA